MLRRGGVEYCGHDEITRLTSGQDRDEMIRGKVRVYFTGVPGIVLSNPAILSLPVCSHVFCIACNFLSHILLLLVQNLA